MSIVFSGVSLVSFPQRAKAMARKRLKLARLNWCSKSCANCRLWPVVSRWPKRSPQAETVDHRAAPRRRAKIWSSLNRRPTQIMGRASTRFPDWFRFNRRKNKRSRFTHSSPSGECPEGGNSSCRSVSKRHVCVYWLVGTRKHLLLLWDWVCPEGGKSTCISVSKRHNCVYWLVGIFKVAIDIKTLEDTYFFETGYDQKEGSRRACQSPKDMFVYID